jgi:beta-lactamase regulating signal transducer with metallopeptidase domain
MNAFPLTTAEFFTWLWRNSWHAAIVVPLILAAQSLCRDRMSPKLRSALWLLVVVRLLWPVSIQTSFSVFNFVTPAAQIAQQTTAPIATTAPTSFPSQSATSVTRSSVVPSRIDFVRLIWFCGAASFFALIATNTFTIWRGIRRERPLINSDALTLLEDCKTEMRVHTPLTLVETSAVAAPMLYGFIRPRLLLPPGLIRDFSCDELRHIFLHELGHLKRGDIAVNWLAAGLLGLHWFNPLIWLAFARMRLDRELACDALALDYARGAQQHTRYGETIIRLVEQFSRPAWAPGVVGIVENRNQIKRRIQMIAQSPNRKSWRALAAILFATLGLITFTEAQSPKEAAPASGKDVGTPRIVKTSPPIGAKDVDPAIKEITITFDRDMAGGFSWTGGPPDFPQGRTGEKPTWRDKRTCALPVSLEAGKYYRVGINSQSHQNFRSAAGVSAKPTSFYFTTKGAGADVLAKTEKPEIVEMTPKNGATDVDAKTTELRVTFNVPMGSGFSWTGGGPSYPSSPEGKRPYWTDDHKTCVLPVELKPGASYRLGLNSPSHKNFQSSSGIPLEPVTYTFKTK